MDTELEGYELFKQNRVNKRGGGVALLVMNRIKCKSIDQIMESVTIQISTVMEEQTT